MIERVPVTARRPYARVACATPDCARPDGHTGYCRPTRHVVVCGAWMRNSRETCARRRGHADRHRTLDALIYDRTAARRAS